MVQSALYVSGDQRGKLFALFVPGTVYRWSTYWCIVCPVCERHHTMYHLISADSGKVTVLGVIECRCGSRYIVEEGNVQVLSVRGL